MNAEILSVGTEILLGDIVNTNAQYVSQRLADLGINIFYQTVVGDNEARLYNTYERAFKHADIVIVTGGLGPTEDDLTKEVGAKYFNKKLILDDASMHSINEHFRRLGLVQTQNNAKQAYFPEGSIIIKNDHGTAPGCIIEHNEKILIMMPGPPKEMKPMFENYIVPYLKSKQENVLVSRVIKISEIGESRMETMVKDLIDQQDNPTIAPYAKDNFSLLRITARAKTQIEAMELITPVAKEIYQRFGENIFGEDEDTIEAVVAKSIIDKDMTIASAESCTGGLLAGTLVNFSGISKVFLEGAVTYSNEAKMKRLGVKADTLDKYGAVSAQIAAEMAEGIAKTSTTNIGISTTGIAGPDGGTEEKPVGLVYVGLYINGMVKTKELHLVGNREKIRERTVFKALDWLRRELYITH
jgi:nicotinamide-nucleotide amidase